MRFWAVFLILFSLVMGCSAKDDERPDLKKFFDEYELSGTFVLLDTNKKQFTRYNPTRAKQRFIPASTFKIANTLIGLETGVIPDETYTFKWNGEKRAFKMWEKDLVLREAFQVSCVPCYQELARNIGPERMSKWVKTLKYGNRNISGGIDLFWLTGDLRISANEQVKFLERLNNTELPLSKTTQQKVKRIMLREEKPTYKLYGKTGWQADGLENSAGKHRIGWVVGFLEQNANVYYLALNVETDNTKDNFAASRVAITEKILKELGLL